MNSLDSAPSAVPRPGQTEQYVYTMPAPPRIVVPPPPSGDDAFDQLDFPPPSIFAPDIAVAQRQSYGPVAQTWVYEKRQQAQQILPYLFLGPMSATKDVDWLQNMGITMALGVKQGSGRLLDGALTRCLNLGIESHGVSVEGQHGLCSVFPTTSQLITGHLKQTLQSSGSLGKVLVFCESGNERSAAVVAAFIMSSHENVDHIRAMQLCQLNRCCAHFDEITKRSLQSWWDLLRAQHGIGSVSDQGAVPLQMTSDTSDAQTQARSRKRGFEQDVSMEGYGIEDGDEERFQNRSVAPFISEYSM